MSISTPARADANFVEAVRTLGTMPSGGGGSRSRRGPAIYQYSGPAAVLQSSTKPWRRDGPIIDGAMPPWIVAPDAISTILFGFNDLRVFKISFALLLVVTLA